VATSVIGYGTASQKIGATVVASSEPCRSTIRLSADDRDGHEWRTTGTRAYRPKGATRYPRQMAISLKGIGLESSEWGIGVVLVGGAALADPPVTTELPEVGVRPVPDIVVQSQHRVGRHVQSAAAGLADRPTPR
jgi:hypothetical protein